MHVFIIIIGLEELCITTVYSICFKTWISIAVFFYSWFIFFKTQIEENNSRSCLLYSKLLMLLGKMSRTRAFAMQIVAGKHWNPFTRYYSDLSSDFGEKYKWINVVSKFRFFIQTVCRLTCLSLICKYVLPNW